MDGMILAGNIAAAANPQNFKIVGEPTSMEPIAIMLRKDDAPFKQAVDAVLRRYMASGEIGRVYDKWLMQAIPGKNMRIGYPANAATRAAWASPNDRPFESYVP